MISGMYKLLMSKASILPIQSSSSYIYQYVSGTGGKYTSIFIEALLVEESDLGFKTPLCPEEGGLFTVI